MALSEHEQEMLDQIERGLGDFGPKSSADRLAAERGSGWLLRRMLIAVAAIAVGLALVLVGLVTKTIVISVLGFIVMVAAAAASGSTQAQLWSRSRRAAIRRSNSRSAAIHPARKPGRTSDEI